MGAVTTACGTAAESGGSQLSSGTGKRRAGGPRGPRRAGRSLGPLVAVPITSVSVAYWVASARPVRRAYLILARRRPPPRRGADRTDRRGFRATLLLPGTGTGQTDVHAQPCVAGLVRPNVGARFLRSKRRAGGGGVQCSAAAGRTIRTVLDDTRCVTSVPPTTLWTVVVDVPVLFRAGFPALLRAAEYNPRLVFFSPCASVAGAPRSCMHEHDGERQTFFYRCSIEFSSVLYTFLFVCYCVSSRYVN